MTTTAKPDLVMQVWLAEGEIAMCAVAADSVMGKAEVVNLLHEAVDAYADDDEQD